MLNHFPFMAARRTKLISLALVLLTMAVIAAVWQNREPRHDGKKLSEWADMGIAATSGPEWRTNDLLLASNAVTQIGARAASWAMRWTRQNRQWVWADGHWDRERAGYSWDEGRWERRGRGHVYVEGRWRSGGGSRPAEDQGPRVRDHRSDPPPPPPPSGPVVRDHR